MAKTYESLVTHLAECQSLSSTIALLEWDQETLMPHRGAARRADQLEVLSRIQHQKKTDRKVDDWLRELEARSAATPEEKAVVRETRRLYDRDVKLPADLVAELAKTRSLATEVWKEARKKNDFPAFAPWIEKLFDLSRRKADAIGHGGTRYDALLDEYEPGMTSAALTAVFAELRKGLVPIVEAIRGSSRRPDTKALAGTYPAASQEAFCRRIAADIGFDFEAGRLDRSAHPFCTGFAPEDVRITTRYDEKDFRGALFGVIHEAGHAMYEQGLDPALATTPAGLARSLGVHESQSRLWENQVGRSRPFWKRWYPELAKAFPDPFSRVDPETFHFAINEVRPSLIRVEADEVTYNLHVILRFDIERDLVAGTLPVKDLPALWNERMSKDLGVRPKTDAEGVLQDIHWSIGLIGYFPTYTLGTLFSAQLYAKARKDVPGLEEGFAEGRFAPLLGWLRERIHRPASRYPTEELVQRAVGEKIAPATFLTYLREKYGPLYGF